jgi:hypothetical protein
MKPTTQLPAPRKLDRFDANNKWYVCGSCGTPLTPEHQHSPECPRNPDNKADAAAPTQLPAVASAPEWKVLGKQKRTDIAGFSVVGRDGETHEAYFANPHVAEKFCAAVNAYDRNQATIAGLRNALDGKLEDIAGLEATIAALEDERAAIRAEVPAKFENLSLPHAVAQTGDWLNELHDRVDEQAAIIAGLREALESLLEATEWEQRHKRIKACLNAKAALKAAGEQ